MLIVLLIKINKETEGPILFKTWHYGWLILENVDAENYQDDGEFSLDQSDKYWMNSWNGGEFDEGMDDPTSEPYSQYNPLFTMPNLTLMQAFFEENQKIGLLGGTFNVIGLLDKPMLYTAPCQPALFND